MGLGFVKRQGISAKLYRFCHCEPVLTPAWQSASFGDWVHNRTFSGKTDCHTSDIGHWFAMTEWKACANASYFYQTVILSAGAVYMPSPSCTPKVSWNFSKFDRGTLQREYSTGCDSLARVGSSAAA